MKQTKKLGLFAAAIVAASQIGLGTVTAAPTTADAQAISQMIGSGQHLELRDYIAANPQVLEGDGALAIALREFYAQVNTIDATGVIRLQQRTVTNLQNQSSIY